MSKEAFIEHDEEEEEINKPLDRALNAIKDLGNEGDGYELRESYDACIKQDSNVGKEEEVGTAGDKVDERLNALSAKAAQESAEVSPVEVKSIEEKLPEWFVEQLNDYDSGIACVAMAARVEYGEVARFFPRDITMKYKDVPNTGRLAVLSMEMSRVLFDLGILHRVAVPLDLFESIQGQEWRNKYKNYIYELTGSDLYDYLVKGGKAILGVRDKKQPNLMHWVYTENTFKVYDPNHMKELRYTDLNTFIAEVIMIGGLPDNGA